ncbi:MAG: response regulator, partial [Acidobacteriota bacterium]
TSVTSGGRRTGGTTFTAVVPTDLEPSKLRAVDDEATFPHDSNMVDGLVLIVDDDELSRKIVAAYIESRGFGVIEAASGEEALTTFRRVRPDAVVMDLGLPGISGLEAIRQIRAEDSARRVVIAALTAHALDGAREECLEAGADLYFSKPARYRELVQAIRELVKDSRAGSGSSA